jgi:hypothetical protein
MSLLAVVCVAALVCQMPGDDIPGDDDLDDGLPYGRVSAEDVDQLDAYARAQGVQLLDDLNKAYRERDAAALSRVFHFAGHFETFDETARVYGHLIYCSLLNLGETWGIERYARVVAKQTPKVQQRLRDFMVYVREPIPQAELAAAMKGNHAAYPDLFPASYEWRKGNSLFASDKNDREYLANSPDRGFRAKCRTVTRRTVWRRRCR